MHSWIGAQVGSALDVRAAHETSAFSVASLVHWISSCVFYTSVRVALVWSRKRNHGKQTPHLPGTLTDLIVPIMHTIKHMNRIDLQQFSFISQQSRKSLAYTEGRPVWPGPALFSNGCYLYFLHHYLWLLNIFKYYWQGKQKELCCILWYFFLIKFKNVMKSFRKTSKQCVPTYIN
jgi:hypothetical protein